MLKSSSTTQTVRLVTGKIQDLDTQGKPTTLEDNRTEPVLKFSTTERLDPGREATQSLEVESVARLVLTHDQVPPERRPGYLEARKRLQLARMRCARQPQEACPPSVR